MRLRRRGELGIDDRRNRDLHLEAVAARVNEPCEGRLVVADVGNQVVAPCAIRDTVPAANGEVGAGDDRDG